MKIKVTLIFYLSFILVSSASAQNKISLDSLKKMIVTADTTSKISLIESVMENYIYKEESDYYLINTMVEIKKDQILTKEGLRKNTNDELKYKVINFIRTSSNITPSDSLIAVYALSIIISDAANNNNYFSIDAQSIIASEYTLEYLIKSSYNKDVKALFAQLKSTLTASLSNNYDYYNTVEFKKLTDSFKQNRANIEKLKSVKK